VTCPHCHAPLAVDARFCGACGRATVGTAPSQVSPSSVGAAVGPDLVGREIGGRYRVVAKLGEGGMGAVYRGEQISLKRKVAIKVLRPELSADAGLVRRFNAEAELCAKLSHPNTVGIYDFGQDSDGSLYIAMELLEGRSLRHVMQEGAMPPARAVAIGQQIARSLADAHSHGITHRDLKPDNVMLTERGRERDVVRVLDFGIAKLRDDNKATVNHMTRAGDLVGTPQYMAPEQIRGEHVDGRTDIYALGAILYEMLTGRLPFEGQSVMAILSKHLTEMPVSPSQRRPDLPIPPALDGLVMAAMAKDPAARPPTMELVGEHLDAIGAQLGLAGGAASASWPAAPNWSGPGPAMPGPPTPPPSGNFGPPAGPMPSPVPAPPHPSPPPGYPSSVGPPGYPPTGPHAPPGPPGYAPTPGPGPYGAPMAPARRRSWTPVLAIVGVLVAGGGAAGIYFATRGPDKTEEPGPGPGSEDDPWAHSGSDRQPGPDDPWAHKGGDDDVDPGSWSTFESPDGRWSIELPPGLPSAPTLSNPGTGVYSFTQFIDGARVEAGAMASLTPIDLSAVPIDQLSGALATQLNATILESGTAMTAGVTRPRVVLQGPSFGQGEGRFYVTDDDFVVFAYYATTGDWDATAGARRQFFDKVVVE
jgi:serine/threonine-protein kinase